jgi:ribosomal protein S27AE
MKRKSPYPKLGTVAGDQVIGACEAIGCGQVLRRGDQFITLLGDRLICGKCNANGFKIKEAAMN